MFFQRGDREGSVYISRLEAVGQVIGGRRALFAALLIVASVFVGTSFTFAPARLDGGLIGFVRGMTGGSAAPPTLGAANGLPISVPLKNDIGLLLYRNAKTRPAVVDFYVQLTGSADIANIIIKVANRYNVPLSLAFALAWKESKFSPTAVNYNGDSVDRGLYQLNSLSFPNLTPAEFYDPQLNAERGLHYLSSCLKSGGNEIVGLAMYNAGTTTVVADGTPRTTLDYISTILRYEDGIISDFQSTVLRQSAALRVIKTAEAKG